jgi:predicted DNA-binding transcriptional regulator AlpA
MENIIRWKGLTEKTKTHRSTLARWIDRGLFPAPFLLVPGGAAVGWRESDIDRWIAERAAQGISDAQ